MLRRTQAVGDAGTNLFEIYFRMAAACGTHAAAVAGKKLENVAFKS